MLFGGAMFTLEAGLQVAQSYMLGELLNAIKTESDDARCYSLAAGVALCAFAYALLHHTGFLCVWRLGQMQQAATIGVVYRKALRISQQALTKTTTGHVVNLVSNDAERFILAAIMVPWLFIAPAQLAVVTWLVWEKVGWSVTTLSRSPSLSPSLYRYPFLFFLFNGCCTIIGSVSSRGCTPISKSC